MVPGTSFVVDKFGGKAYEAAPRTKHWFLTHFHADHYGGLGPRFKQGQQLCADLVPHTSCASVAGGSLSSTHYCLVAVQSPGVCHRYQQPIL